jgi:hypothetical protein
MLALSLLAVVGTDAAWRLDRSGSRLIAAPIVSGSVLLLERTGTMHPGSVWIQVGAHVGGPDIAKMLAVVVGHLAVGSQMVVAPVSTVADGRPCQDHAEDQPDHQPELHVALPCAASNNSAS